MTITSFNLVTKASWLGVRHVQVMFLFTCAYLAFHNGINLSVGIVAMTNANSSNANYPEYQLTEPQKSYMLSSQFWGLCFTQLLGGYMSNRYGSKLLLFGITLVTAVLSISLPQAMAWGGWQLFSVIRWLQGVAMGGLWPCFYTHLAKWVPKQERNRLGGLMQTGLDFGVIMGYALSGVLAASPFGWPSVYYVPGILGLVWSLFWLCYGANSPADSPYISLAELKLIQLAQEQELANRIESPPVPWRQILTSVPFLVLAFCKMSQTFNTFTLMQQIPRYMNGIFRLDIQLNALLSAVPFVVMCMMSFLCIFLADYLTRKCKISLVVLRKSLNSVASWIPAVALVALSFISTENVMGNIGCMIVAVAATACQAIGSSLNHLDLSPNFAGVLYGISNTLMSLAGVISPLLIGLIVTVETDRTQWRLVFLGIALILFVGNLLYLIFGQMTVQTWNDPKQVVTKTKVDQITPELEISSKSSLETFSYL